MSRRITVAHVATADITLRYTLVADDGLRRRFGQASRVRALQEFDERRVIGCVLDVYKKLLVRKELLGDSTASIVQAIGSESAAQR